MNAPLRRILTAIVVLGCAAQAAEEKNGLSVTVAKTTLDRSDTRYSSYYSARIDRVQALKATVKNVSFKPMAEGEVEWEILVRKYYSTSVESYKGKEKLKPLRPAETTELIMGAAQIQGWRDGTDQAKDKIEWQLTIKQEGKEVMKTASTSGFDALAKRAMPMAPPNR